MTYDPAIQDKQEEIAATSSEVEVPADQSMHAGEQFEDSNPADGSLTLQTLPQEARDALPEDAQQIFIAAYNSIIDGNGDRAAAERVAWQTIEHSEQYVKGNDGKWHHTASETANHNPSPFTAA